MKQQDRTLRLTVRARLEEVNDDELPGGMVYLYDRSGRLLASQELPPEAEGEVSLELPARLRGQTVRVVVGPPPKPAGEDQVPAWIEAMLKARGEFPRGPLPATLKRLGAVEKTVRLAEEGALTQFVVYPVDWARWFTCHCLVRGRLIKRVPMPDGTVQEWGVCHACVLIYEVDAFPLIIARLPDPDIYRLRDDILDLITRPRIPPEWRKKFEPKVWPPPPPPPPEWGAMSLMSLPAGADEAVAESNSPTLETVVEGLNLGAIEQAPAAVQSLALATSASQLRSELILHPHLFIKVACLLPWFMSWFKKDLIKLACTDENGYFETTIPYTCFGDHPDLYFKAVQCIGGSLHVLYDPGMVCHTHWNYPCGSEVVLETTDPAAIVCAPPDPVDPPPGVGTWVLINRVGGILINSIGSDGLVGYDFVAPGGHVTATGAPFGATLGLRVSHSPDIPKSQIRYYRWLYNKDGDVDSLGDPVWHEFGTPLAPSVGRHYADYDLTQPLKPPTFPIYTLGPKGVGTKTMYEFRPQPTELQATAPPNHVYQWPVEAIGNDIYSGLVDSTSLPGGPSAAVGKYWFRLEVYDDAGNQVLPGAGTFQFIVLTTAAGDSRLAFGSEVQDGGFVFCLHVDNRVCQAIIDAPSIGGVGADPNCGFLHYAPGDSVALNFHALHPSGSYGAAPADRATFHFWIRRGAGVIKNISGEVATPAAGDWTGDYHGNFAASFTPAALLGPCSKAAFAEILRVYAKATNGWRRLDEYDAGTEWAFALAPKTP